MIELDDLTRTQRRILARLAESPPWPPSIRELARTAGVHSPSTVWSALTGLRAQGLVHWIDRRPRTLTITPAGRVQAELIRAAHARRLHDAEASLFARTEVKR